MKRPSVLAEKVAQKIRDAFKEQYGLLCNVFAGDFRTADGFWRRVDVYRWQIYLETYDGERWSRQEVCSWATLKACRNGHLVLWYDKSGLCFEADPVKGKRKPDNE